MACWGNHSKNGMLVDLLIKVCTVAKITTATTETPVILTTKITVERKKRVGRVNWVIKVTPTSRRFQIYVNVDFHTNTPGADGWSGRYVKSNSSSESAANKRSPFSVFIICISSLISSYLSMVRNIRS